ncbi:hypothetical protein QYF61_015809 [Mycteria americana]|uniref:Uncharacterized protein n=1 Tax=Mycteria americana TaxID=33587 RepID=A0AAN7RUY4_MYCAM|nr:hypothetical protein QYF61_015809 [Mycteria americana]
MRRSSYFCKGKPKLTAGQGILTPVSSSYRTGVTDVELFVVSTREKNAFKLGLLEREIEDVLQQLHQERTQNPEGTLRTDITPVTKKNSKKSNDNDNSTSQNGPQHRIKCSRIQLKDSCYEMNMLPTNCVSNTNTATHKFSLHSKDLDRDRGQQEPHEIRQGQIQNDASDPFQQSLQEIDWQGSSSAENIRESW